MKRSDPYLLASLRGEDVIRERGISAFPVEPIDIACELDIEVVAKPVREGASGMLLRVGNSYGIVYAGHIDNPGFERFSIAHELGHYFLPGHIDAVLGDSDIHESYAGFESGDRYEVEADHFAAALLMPRQMFSAALRRAGEVSSRSSISPGFAIHPLQRRQFVIPSAHPIRSRSSSAPAAASIIALCRML
jgi:IrrE N-terminal-like domain